MLARQGPETGRRMPGQSTTYRMKPTNQRQIPAASQDYGSNSRTGVSGNKLLDTGSPCCTKTRCTRLKPQRARAGRVKKVRNFSFVLEKMLDISLESTTVATCSTLTVGVFGRKRSECGA